MKNSKMKFSTPFATPETKKNKETAQKGTKSVEYYHVLASFTLLSVISVATKK